METRRAIGISLLVSVLALQALPAIAARTFPVFAWAVGGTQADATLFAWQNAQISCRSSRGIPSGYHVISVQDLSSANGPLWRVDVRTLCVVH